MFKIEICQSTFWLTIIVVAIVAFTSIIHKVSTDYTTRMKEAFTNGYIEVSRPGSGEASWGKSQVETSNINNNK